MGLGRHIEKTWEKTVRAVTGKADRIERRPLFRMAIVLAGLILVLVAALAQAWRYQGSASGLLSQKARRQTSGTASISGNRGSIYDSSGKRLLAVTVRKTSVVSTGNSWPDDWVEIASAFSPILDMSEADIFAKLWSARTNAVEIKKDISQIEEHSILRLNLPGIVLTTSESRYYPLEKIMGSVLGFVRPDEKIAGVMSGRLGVEGSYNEILTPSKTSFPVSRDKDSRLYYEGALGDPWNLDGASLDLTIDARLQIVVDSALAAAVRDEQAIGGMAVVLDPATFDVLAMSSYPFLDPNRYSEQCAVSTGMDDGSNPCRNKVLGYAFEPGSVAKILALASILESSEKLGLKTEVDGHNGRCRVGDQIVTDLHPVGEVTLRDAVKFSSNCAMADGVKRIQPAFMREVYAKLGVGSAAGVDLPGENPGSSRPDWTPVDAQAASYGYGFTTTLMNMAVAFATIVNDGVRLQPHVVSRIRMPDGSVKSPDSAPPFRAVSSRAARAARQAMYTVVMDDEGTGHRARPRGYTAAGKTGTARIARKKDQPKGYHCSFAGFAPATAPKVVIAVTLIDPKKNVHGGSSAAPLFARMVERLLPLLGVEPSGKDSKASSGETGSVDRGDVQ